MKSALTLLFAVLCATALYQTTAAVAQQTPPVLETIGNGSWKGRTSGFRIYSTSDGNKARVDYVTFPSDDEAKHEVATCLSSKAKTISKQERKDNTGSVSGERVIAVWDDSGHKQYALIRRIGRNCWFISSSSLASAIQVEELIEE